MKFMLQEIRFLLSGLGFGFAFMPAILWYAHFKYDVHVFVFNANLLYAYYLEFYTRLEDPLTWFYLLIPYLLLRLILLLFRSKAPRSLATSPLAHAAARGEEDIVRTLLTKGSDINAGNHAGQTPLHLAADQGNSSVTRILLEQGALVDVVETAAGHTPLHYAARHGHTDLCELLIRFGADPDALTGNMDTPLHLAIEAGQAGVVAVLLKYRAKLGIKNRNGLTPLQLAEHLKNREIVNLINRHLSEAWPYLQISRC
jgi:ankyrin repeat protein